MPERRAPTSNDLGRFWLAIPRGGSKENTVVPESIPAL
jgi:hypothetical protein